MKVSVLSRWQLESAQKYDDSERTLGDVLDVKASVTLVAVTFLAGISAQLVTMQGLSALWSEIQMVVQIVALIVLALAGGFIIAELWPSDYKAPATPKEDAKWIDELQAFGKNPNELLDTVVDHRLTSAIERVEHNKKINEKKSRSLYRTFLLLAGAGFLVVGNLLCLAIKSLWPILKSLLKP